MIGASLLPPSVLRQIPRSHPHLAAVLVARSRDVMSRPPEQDIGSVPPRRSLFFSFSIFSISIAHRLSVT